VKSNDELKGVGVLIVDDDQDILQILRLVLERRGAIVTSVDSVSRALDIYASARPNVIVADIGMPDYNGFALIARIRQEDAKSGRITPAIALTAFTSPADRELALSAGFQEYMAKPFHPADLVSTISKLVGPTESTDRKGRAA
jgi:CheY-like chemotaxis protein